jgi:predicted CoA-substrate-specific enzyme activase
MEAIAETANLKRNGIRVQDVLDRRYVADLAQSNTLGIDIGSRQAKAVLIADGVVYTAITASEVDQQETADRLVKKLHRLSGLPVAQIDHAVSTGYGRITLAFTAFDSSSITEISCHAMGAHVLDPDTRTIIDIGGQDSKAIRIDPSNGRVLEFVMNDKCAAGTGRFLERVAELLGIAVEDLGVRALGSEKRVEISSQCVVFGESEVISLKAMGTSIADIAAGIHFASARRVRNLVNRVGLAPKLVFTGGVAKNLGMKHALEEVIGHAISSGRFDLVYAGALGAAALAQRVVAGTGVAA